MQLHGLSARPDLNGVHATVITAASEEEAASLEQKGRAGEARAVTILGAQYSEGRVGYAEAMQALAQLIGKDEIVAFVRRAAHGLE